MTTLTAPTSIASAFNFQPPREIALEEIRTDGGNYRAGELFDVAGLAESMGTIGLLTPVLVTPEEDGYRVVAGHRRVAAANRLAWAGIDAIVVTTPDGDPIPDDSIEELRAVENIVREQLSPLEEAMAVAKVLDGANGDIRRAAGILGRSESWVRDRGYIAKFEGKARALVASGRLPLGHARLIARVTDPKAREKLAEEAASDGPNAPPMRLIQLEYRVGNLIRSLGKVPWELDKPFGGLPACRGCPSNSDTDRYLFGAAESDTASCGDARCFQRKVAAASKAIDKAVTKLTVKGKDADTSAAAVRAVTPVGIKAGSIQRAVKKAAGVKEKPKPAKDEVALAKPDAWKIQQEWFKSLRDPQEKALVQAMKQRFLANPDAILKLGLFVCGGVDRIEDLKSLKALTELLNGPSAIDWLAGRLADPSPEDSVDDMLGEVFSTMIPWGGPPTCMLQEFGVAPIESREKYVKRRLEEEKRAAAQIAQAKKRNAVTGPLPTAKEAGVKVITKPQPKRRRR